SLLPFAHLHFHDKPPGALEMRGLRLLQRLELVCQSKGGVIVVAYMLVILCQVLESWHALTLGKTLPDRHSEVPELTAFVQQVQIEEASRIEVALMGLQMGERGALVAPHTPVPRNGYNVGTPFRRRAKGLSKGWQ